MRFEFIEHTADQQVRAYGKNLDEAFSNAAVGMFEVITETSKVKAKHTKHVKVEAPRLNTLLYDFLEELLFFLDTEGFLLHDMRNLSIKKTAKGYTLAAIAVGDTDEGYEVTGNLKSITYHQMKVVQGNTKVTIDYVLDI